ncbi:hypothetical protein RUM43_012569, partial [Polyplax serrata]
AESPGLSPLYMKRTSWLDKRTKEDFTTVPYVECLTCITTSLQIMLVFNDKSGCYIYDEG